MAQRSNGLRDEPARNAPACRTVGVDLGERLSHDGEMCRGFRRRRLSLMFDGRGSSQLNLDRGDVKLAQPQLGRDILEPNEKRSRVSLLTDRLVWAGFSTSIVLRLALSAFHKP